MMHKILSFIAAGTLVGCQLTADSATTAQSAALSTDDCVTGQNFPDAKMPPLSTWPQVATPPMAGDTASFVVFPSDLVANGYLALLVDAGTGTITWGAKVPAAALPQLVGVLSTRGQLDIVRKPPKPPPQPGTEAATEARFALEVALRASSLAEHGWRAAQPLTLGN
jgi:hypothetical protein